MPAYPKKRCCPRVLRTLPVWLETGSRLLQTALFAAMLLGFASMSAWAQVPLSPWGAHEMANQTGTAHWTYFSVTVPIAIRTLQENAVSLATDPGSAASAYAVEERLFAGFIATDISGGGTFVPSENVIRWGPYFDPQPRTFTYTLVPPAGFDGEIALLGLLSADGESFPVTGRSILRFGSTPLPPPVQTDLSGDRLALAVSGPLNATVIIETADQLDSSWSEATRFRLNKPGQDWSVPVEIQQSGRFFRVRVEVR